MFENKLQKFYYQYFMKLQRFFILVSFVISISALFLSCKKENTDTIRIGILKGPTEISFMKMMNDSPIINGRKVEFIVKNEPMQIQALIMRKEVDFAVLPTVMAANLYNKGVKFQMIASPVWGTLYLLSNQSSITKLEDIENVETAVFGQGVTPDILFKNLLEQKNIKNVKLNYSYTSNSDVAGALLQRKVKTAVLSEPAVSILIARDSSIRIVSEISCIDFVDNAERDIFVQTAFLVSNQFSEKFPDATRKISSEYRASCNFINNYPEESAQLAVKLHLFPDITTARISLPLCNIRYIAAFAIEHEMLHYLDIFMSYDKRSIGGKFPDTNFIYK